MKHLLSNLVAGVAALSVTSSAVAAISISLEPTPQTINVGDPATMDLVVSGLGNLSAPSLGAFDFDLSYDAAIISAVSLTFGTDLGTPLESSRFFTLAPAGAIHLDEVSFKSSSDLNSAQPDTFTLATVNFNGVAPGTSGIGFTFASLSDEQAQSLVGFSMAGGSIRVMPPTHIPDAGSMASLLLLGMVSLSALRKFSQTALR